MTSRGRGGGGGREGGSCYSLVSPGRDFATLDQE